jgi:DNA topoisomerase-6 subunit B
MAGFGNPSQALFTTVREFVENSLDACDAAQVQPVVEVTLSRESSRVVTVTVADNGCGVPTDKVPDAFGRVLFGSKYSPRQRRGTFGLGATMAILYGQVTTDLPAAIHTRTKDGEGVFCRVFIDVENNTPLLDVQEHRPRAQTGTTISVQLTGDLTRSKDRILEYLRLSTLSSPHALLRFSIEGEESAVFGGTESGPPPLPMVARPHPRSADIEALRRAINRTGKKGLQDFLIDTYQQVGRRAASGFIRFMNLDPKRIVSEMSREELSMLSQGLRKYDGFSRPDGSSLSPIGKLPFQNAISSMFDTTIVSYAARGPNEWEGSPYVIEGVIALSDEFPISDTPQVYRFANRVPLLYDSNDDLFTKTLKRVNWSTYYSGTTQPAALFVHICSTQVPYVAAGKQAIASVGDLDSEILALLRDLGRGLGHYTRINRRGQRDQKKLREYTKSFKMLVSFSADLAGQQDPPDVGLMVNQLFEVV